MSDVGRRQPAEAHKREAADHASLIRPTGTGQLAGVLFVPLYKVARAGLAFATILTYL